MPSLGALSGAGAKEVAFGSATSGVVSGTPFTFASAGSASAFKFGGPAPAGGAFPPVQNVFGAAAAGGAFPTFGGTYPPCPIPYLLSQHIDSLILPCTQTHQTRQKHIFPSSRTHLLDFDR